MFKITYLEKIKKVEHILKTYYSNVEITILEFGTFFYLVKNKRFYNIFVNIEFLIKNDVNKIFELVEIGIKNSEVQYGLKIR